MNKKEYIPQLGQRPTGRHRMNTITSSIASAAMALCLGISAASCSSGTTSKSTEHPSYNIQKDPVSIVFNAWEKYNRAVAIGASLEEINKAAENLKIAHDGLPTKTKNSLPECIKKLAASQNSKSAKA